MRAPTLCAVLLGAATGCGGAAAHAPGPVAAASPPPLVISSGGEAPVGTPYSQREHHEHLALLTANGFTDARPSWRQAAAAGDAALRAAACALLAEAPLADDRQVLEAAFADPAALVRTWAALGLARLGDPRGALALAALAKQPSTATEHAPLIAAAALARLGDRAGAPTLTAAFADDDLRLDASKRLLDLARLDLPAALPLFARSLADRSATVRALALSQLEELRAPASRPLLEDFTRSAADQLERARATQLLSSLPQ